MIAEFTIIGLVVRCVEFNNGIKRMFRINIAVNNVNRVTGHRNSMYINNVTIWGEGAIELAKKVISPGSTIFVRGRITSISSARKKGLSKDSLYLNAETFFVLKKSEKDIETGRFKREMGDFLENTLDYDLLPGEVKEHEGYYPTYCGDIPDDEGGYDVPKEPEE